MKKELVKQELVKQDLFPVNPQVEIMSLVDSLNIPTVAIEAPKSLFLPYIYVNQKDKEDLYKVILCHNGQQIPMNEAYTLVPITARKMLRLLEGQRYTKRFYQGGKTNDLFDQNKGKPGFKEGIFILVALLNDNGAIIASLEACGAVQTYWAAPLSLCKFEKGIAVKITDISHANNVKQGPNGTYLSGYKFKGYEPVTLTDVQLKAIHAAMQKQKEQIELAMQE